MDAAPEDARDVTASFLLAKMTTDTSPTLEACFSGQLARIRVRLHTKEPERTMAVVNG